MKGIGTDILQIARVTKTLERHGERFIERILTTAEQAIYQQRQQSLAFLASRFAAKEAIAKALGTGIAQGICFTDIEVLPGPAGAPQVTLYRAAKQQLRQAGAQHVKVSLSDERDYALAFAVIF